MKIIDNDQVMGFQGFVQSSRNPFFQRKGVEGLNFIKKIGEAQEVPACFQRQALEHKSTTMATGYAQTTKGVLLKLLE
jgi:hypothetical protein